MEEGKRIATEEWVKDNFSQYIKGTPSFTKDCVTKLWLVNNYNINVNKLNLLNDKDLVKRELIEGEQIIFDEFDYCVVRYKWTSESGKDLDTATYFKNTNESTIDDKRVGWGFQNSLPLETSIKFIDWVNDNTQSGIEAVLIDFKSLTSDLLNLPNIIQCYLRSAWYAELKTGYTDLEFTTYKGGVMEKDIPNYNFINNGGVIVQSETISRYVDTKRQSYPTIEMTLMGVIEYDKITKKASLKN